MNAGGNKATRRARWSCAVVCALMLAGFAIASYRAAIGKSPAFDESAHAMNAWMTLRWQEYRIAPESPPLWHLWAALPNGRDAIKADFTVESWTKLAQNWPAHWPFTIQTLFRTPGNDGIAFVNRSRLMMVFVGVMLGALAVVWAWRLAGPVAGLVTGGLFCLDPNFLAHAALVQNDVALALVYLLVAWATWQVGLRLTFWRVLILGIVIGAGLCVKMSALLVVPIVTLMLTVRALQRDPWTTGEFRNPQNTKSPVLRVFWVAGVLLSCAAVSFSLIWCVYRFNRGASSDPSVHFDVTPIIGRIAFLELTGGDPSVPVSREALSNWSPPLMASLALWAIDSGILPEPYAFGLLATSRLTSDGLAYFLGETTSAGSILYFPVAVLVKTPVTTLAVMALASVGGFVFLRQWKRKERDLEKKSLASDAKFTQTVPLPNVNSATHWTFICLIAPPLIYFVVAMSQQLNLGVRHVLMIYPFAFILTGMMMARILERFRIARITMIGAGLCLLVETTAAFPNFIPFFNVFAGGSRGGLSILGDSNLDWGQDLPALATWQNAHPDRTLYLSYFGTVPPESYGLRYVNLSGGYKWNSEIVWPPKFPGVVAMSATQVQGIYLSVEGRQAYKVLIDRCKLFEVLNGSIYLYELPPSE